MARLLWTQKGRFGPLARYHHAATFDAARQRVVVFGGTSLAQPGRLQDTWEWDGQIWVQTADFGPSPRERHAMTYDAARQRVVMFGGYAPDGASPGTRGDTWEWNGDFWTQVSDTGPTPRTGHALAYDGGTGRVVLYGGSGADNFEASLETWEWDGDKWTQVESEIGPGRRVGHAMAYDDVRKRVTLFGGEAPPNEQANRETWERNGLTWTRVAMTGPDPRHHHATAGALGRIVLFGGFTDAGTDNTTWQWDGKHWAQRGNFGPRPRFSPAMAYDSARARLVLFGGQDAGIALGDTWELSEYGVPAPAPA